MGKRIDIMNWTTTKQRKKRRVLYNTFYEGTIKTAVEDRPGQQ